jgi:hypothetical protein
VSACWSRGWKSSGPLTQRRGSSLPSTLMMGCGQQLSWDRPTGNVCSTMTPWLYASIAAENSSLASGSIRLQGSNGATAHRGVSAPRTVLDQRFSALRAASCSDRAIPRFQASIGGSAP